MGLLVGEGLAPVGAAGADGEGLAPDDVAGPDRRWGPIAAGLDGEGLAPVDGAAGAGLVPLRWADAAVVAVVCDPTQDVVSSGRIVPVASPRGGIYEFERTVRKLTCACASAQLLRPLRSWVSQFWRRGLDLLPSSAVLMTCRHLPGLMSMTPLRPNRSLWGRAGRRWGAVDGVVVVPTGPLLLLGLDAVVMRQSPPLGTMWKLAESSKLAVCGWWERCSSCRPAPSSRFGESK